MKTVRGSSILTLFGLLAFLALFTAFVMIFSGPAFAGQQTEWVVYLPHVVVPQEPLDSYESDFTGSVEPWGAVRWKEGTVFTVEHYPGCDGGRCGFLDLAVSTPQTYVNVSPLIEGPQPPYDIRFRAKQNNIKDRVQYGMVFGADWQKGPCPGDNTGNCFNQYYEFRVLHRVLGADKFVQYRIRRIDGMDENQNEAYFVTLLNWTQAAGVDAEDWIEWEVHYGSDGHMTIKANGQEQEGSAYDDTYIDSLYFGIAARGGPYGNTEARFDEFSIFK